jgi:hypothetical protein
MKNSKCLEPGFGGKWLVKKKKVVIGKNWRKKCRKNK